MKRKNCFVTHCVGNETIIIPVGKQVLDLNGIITLNDTAQFIWDILAEERTFDEMADALVTRFHIDSTTSNKDLRVFLDSIDKMGLLEHEQKTL